MSTDSSSAEARIDEAVKRVFDAMDEGIRIAGSDERLLYSSIASGICALHREQAVLLAAMEQRIMAAVGSIPPEATVSDDLREQALHRFMLNADGPETVEKACTRAGFRASWEAAIGASWGSAP